MRPRADGRPIPDGFEHRELKAIALRALVPADHPLADAEGNVPVDELEPYPILLNSRGFLASQLVHAAFRLAEIEPKVVYESSVGQTLAALAENGSGVALLSDTVDLRGFDLVNRRIIGRDGEPIQFMLHLAWRPNLEGVPELQSLVDELTSFVAVRSPSDDPSR